VRATATRDGFSGARVTWETEGCGQSSISTREGRATAPAIACSAARYWFYGELSIVVYPPKRPKVMVTVCGCGAAPSFEALRLRAGNSPAPSARLRSEYDSAGRSMAIEAARDQMC